MLHSRAKSPLFTFCLSVTCFIRHLEDIIYERLKKAFFTAFLSFFAHHSDFGKILSNSRVILQINPYRQVIKLWLYLLVKLLDWLALEKINKLSFSVNYSLPFIPGVEKGGGAQVFLWQGCSSKHKFQLLKKIEWI